MTPSTAAGLRLAICTDTYAPQVNGVARTLHRLVGAVERRGGAAAVFTAADPLAIDDGRVRRYASRPFAPYPQLRMALPGARRLASDLEAWGPTLVHAATPFGVGLAARGAARRLGVPFVSSYHTHFGAYLAHYRLDVLQGVVWPFLRWFHNGGRRTYCPSRSVAHELETAGFRHTTLWTRGVDADAFHPRHRSRVLRDQWGAGDDRLVIAYVGRLAPEKGLDAAFAGVRLAMAELPGRFVFVLAGEGPAEAHVRAIAPPQTILAGTLEGQALAACYASADVFLFPSVTETFGNVVLEAMASGLAVVAPDEGATTDFAHAPHVLPCRVRDPRDIAARLVQLALDAELRGRLARAARAAAEARSWTAVFDALLADYGRVLREAAGGSPAVAATHAAARA